MVNLTVGHVSGMIAAAIYILQFLIPNAIILILVAVLKDNHTAITWSSVQRSLASSLWPIVMRTDASRSHHLDRGARAIGWLQMLAALLLAVAAIVTPLGLTDTIAPQRRIQHVPFSYVRDAGPMGYGTPPVNSQGFARFCNFLPCPGTSLDATYTGNATDYNVTFAEGSYDTRIPRDLASLYQSGLKLQPQTVSSYFDIQSRQYSYTIQQEVNHDHPYVVDTFRNLNTMILDDAIEAVEGLIVDTKNGAVGLRNHTVPTSMQYAADWTEDLLFIEPETQCVDLGLHYEFILPLIPVDGVTNLSLIDDGGFADINTTYPEPDYSEAQKDPLLRERAYKAAWVTKVLTMAFLNVTRPNPHAFAYINSKVGQPFPLPNTSSSELDMIGWNGIGITELFSYLVYPDAYNTTPLSNFTFDGLPNPTLTSIYPNVFNVSHSNYTSIPTLCRGAGGKDLVSMNHIAISCGLVFGAGRRKDGVESLILEPNTWWTQPIYSCASVVKASIKSVHLKWNATVDDGLKGLQVLNISDKHYASQADMPLWGTEHLDMNLATVTPLWGLIDPKLDKSVNLSTIQAPQFYIPGFPIVSLSNIPGQQYLPASDTVGKVMETIYGDLNENENGFVDYTGAVDISMFRKWQELTTNEKGTAKMINLIATDFFANALHGTRSWNSGDPLPPNLQRRDDSSASTSSSGPLVPVQVYSHQIRYNWLFAIPALLLLLLSTLVLIVSFFLTLTGRTGPGKIKHYMSHLSTGRLFTTYLYPGECDGLAPTRLWIKRVGWKMVRLDRNEHFATAASDADEPEKPDGDGHGKVDDGHDDLHNDMGKMDDKKSSGAGAQVYALGDLGSRGDQLEGVTGSRERILADDD